VRVQKQLDRRNPRPSFWGEVASRSAKALMSFAIARAGKLAIERAGDRLGDEARSDDQVSAF
jgi:hypothetical protein